MEISARNPFFLARHITPQSLEQPALRLLEAVGRWLSSLGRPLALKLLLVLSSIVLIVKIVTILSHCGFITGDDVEIQEMTLGHLLRTEWRVWEIRSPVYPMTVVYPPQALAHALGINDTSALVLIGRGMAAVLSTGVIAALFVGARRAAGSAPATIAAVLGSVSHLLINFGASELPRPTSAVLTVLGFGCLLGRSGGGALVSGVLVGIAATLRFSEIIFIIPGMLQLILQRRLRDLAVFSIAVIVVAGTIQLSADMLYWGDPFHSLIRIIQYTIIEGKSSRGYEPAWFYLLNVTSWTDPLTGALAVAGTSRRTWRVALWAWCPIIILSLLPHKEPRYLVPAMPFVLMLAGIKLWDLAQLVLRRARNERAIAGRFALGLCVAVTASLIYEVSRWHVHRSDDAVRLARSLARQHVQGTLAAEQLWRMGGRLYLGRLPSLTDLDPASLTTSGISAVAEDQTIRWIALRTDTCRLHECVQVFKVNGLDEQERAVSSDYRLFARAREND